MGWWRGCYYRSRRVGGRVVNRYLGKGPAALQAASADSAQRQQRQVRRRRIQELAGLEEPVVALAERAALLASAALVAAGYHRPGRYLWRKRRGTPVIGKHQVDGSVGIDSLREVVRRAEGGDPGAMAEFRCLIGLRGVLDLAGGDLAHQTQVALVRRHAGGNPVIEEALVQKLFRVQEDLAGPAAGPVERLVVDSAVTAWLHLWTLEMAYAGKESWPLETADFYLRAIARAERRFLHALKQLHALRRLLPRTVATAADRPEAWRPRLAANSREGGPGNPS
jgi:hypothetical protein